MNDTLFYVLMRVSSGEPLVDEFLLGNYDRDETFKTISEIQDGETVRFSKNIARLPKILGKSRLVLPTDLMLDLRTRITVKWRKVEFTSLFDFEWTDTGFEIFQRYIDEQEERFRKQGIQEFDLEFHVNSDEGLAYLDFVERYKISDFEFPTNYWEMVVNSSTRVANLESKKDALSFVVSKNDKPFFELRDDSSEKLLSLSSLHDSKVLSMTPRCLAIEPNVFEKFRPFLEPDLFVVYPILPTDLPSH